MQRPTGRQDFGREGHEHAQDDRGGLDRAWWPVAFEATVAFDNADTAMVLDERRRAEEWTPPGAKTRA
jgi:hypothetical protein